MLFLSEQTVEVVAINQISISIFCIRLSIDCLGANNTYFTILKAKLYKELYRVRIQKAICFLLFFVSFFECHWYYYSSGIN